MLLCNWGSDCVRNHKLIALAPGCWLPIQFTRPYDVVSGSLVSGVANVHKAGTLTFRYAHLGPGPAGILLQDMIRGTHSGRRVRPDRQPRCVCR